MGAVYVIQEGYDVLVMAKQMHSIPFLIGNFIRMLFHAIFFTLIWLAAMSIEAIIEDIRSCPPPNVNCVAQLRMRQWWRSYNALQDFVEEVNAFFATFLVVVIGSAFVDFSFTSYKLIDNVINERKQLFDPAVDLLVIIFMLGMKIFVTERMEEKVI